MRISILLLEIQHMLGAMSRGKKVYPQEIGPTKDYRHIMVHGINRSAIFKFENRYKSIHCDEETSLLVLVHSIHLNPV
jgi:hypothetical protein